MEQKYGIFRLGGLIGFTISQKTTWARYPFKVIDFEFCLLWNWFKDSKQNCLLSAGNHLIILKIHFNEFKYFYLEINLINDWKLNC